MEEFKQAVKLMLPAQRETIRCGLSMLSKHLRNLMNGDELHDKTLREEESSCDQMIDIIDSIN
jgi:16S rRNA A1518/A1519 N6-dimethyltransferase RsmA/KsgA/DIM1 with predicted DNA glycosylase/AP lyase activity